MRTMARSASIKDRVMERLPSMERLTSNLPFRRPPPPSKIKRAAPLIGAGAAGAVFAFLFDPDRGKSRRAKARDMTVGSVRRLGRRTERKRRYLASKAYGLRQRAAHGLAGNGGRDRPDDVTLADKVRSEVLRRYEKGRLVVNAEDGVVVLRGEVTTPDDVKRLEKQVRELPGVVDVENLLHLKGSFAVNKRASIAASRAAGM